MLIKGCEKAKTGLFLQALIMEKNI